MSKDLPNKATENKPDYAPHAAKAFSVILNAVTRQTAQRAAVKGMSQANQAPVIKDGKVIDPLSFKQFYNGVLGRIPYSTVLMLGVSEGVNHLSNPDTSFIQKTALKAILETLPFGALLETRNTVGTHKLPQTALAAAPFLLTRNAINWCGIGGIISDEKYKVLYTGAQQIFNLVTNDEARIPDEDPSKQMLYILSKKMTEGALMGVISTAPHNVAIKVMTEMQSNPEASFKETYKNVFDYFYHNQNKRVILTAISPRIIGCMASAVYFSQGFQEAVADGVRGTIDNLDNSLLDAERINEIKNNSKNMLRDAEEYIKRLLSDTKEVDQKNDVTKNKETPNPSPVLTSADKTKDSSIKKGAGGRGSEN